jgi:3-oxoacyl-[acyl-carrier protein] reductase
MGSLSGKVAIVTGASNGIGRAIAERLAEDGAIVVVNYNQSDEKAKQVITGIQAKGGKAVAFQADMSQVAEVRRLLIESVKQFGGSTFSSTMPGDLCQRRFSTRPRLTSIRSSP